MTLDLPALRGEIRRKDTTPARLLDIAALDPQLSRSVAKAKTTPPQVLDRLARSPDMPTRARVAEHSATPLPTLAHLAGDPQWTVLKALTENPNLPADLLLGLSRHKRATVRAAAVRAGLARGPLAPEDWTRLRQDPAEEVRLELAYWTALDIPHALELLQDAAAEVRRVVAQRQTQRVYLANHRQIPQVAQPLSAEQLLPLLDDESGEVRLPALRALHQLGFNFLLLPTEQRQKLVLGDDARVSEEILRRFWPDWFSGAETGAEQETLAGLRQNPAEAVRLLALRLTGDLDVVQTFADDPGESVRAEVAARVPDLPTLQKLAQDAEPWVRYYLTFNPHLPCEWLLRVVGTLELPLTFRPQWGGPYVAPLLTHPSLTDADLRALLADDGPLSRTRHKVELNYIYRDHRATWAKILKILVESRDPDVLAALLEWMPPADIRAELKTALERHAPQLLPRYRERYER